ncbi:MAG: peptidyl-prolyl cis-trans isomerase [Caulobacterales bacterium]|nr:peptidyl-prolyl cis-trans isomerase [Caulobacterales bacterium]
MAAPDRPAPRLLGWLRLAVAQPLVHFVILGGVVFALHAAMSGGREPADTLIRFDEGQVRWLSDSWRAQFGRAPTPPQLRTAIERQASEEMRYREAMALGLDRDDTVVRRRMAQKHDFLLGEGSAPSQPSDRELRAYHAAHQARYQAPTTYSYCQVFYGGDSDGTGLARARTALAGLSAAERAGPATRLAGLDLLPAPRCQDRIPADRLAAAMGPDFAAALPRMPRGTWAGPVQSGYGYHLVRVTAAEPGGPLSFDQARARAETDWRADAVVRARQADEAKLRRRYRISIDEGALTRFSRPAP